MNKLLESIMEKENVNLEEATRIKEEVSVKVQDLWQKTINEEGCYFREIIELIDGYEDTADLFGD